MHVSNKELVKKINAAFSNGNEEFVSAHLTADVRWNIVGMPCIEGKDNFLKTMHSMELWQIVWPGKNSPANIKTIVAEGDYVVVENAEREDAKSVRTVGTAHCDIYRIKDGKIQELTTYVVDTTLNE